MRKFILLSFSILISISLVNAQISLEKQYTTFYPENLQTILAIQDIGNNNYKYIASVWSSKTNRDSALIFYNLDHSIYKQITIPNIFSTSYGYKAILCQNPSKRFPFVFVGSTIFDTDNEIEYAIMYGQFQSGYRHTMVFLEENGTEILRIDSIGYESYYITPSGNNTGKLIIDNIEGTFNSGHVPYRTEIYNLGGQLPSNVIQIQNQGINGKLSNAYPNPSQGTYTINYELPQNVNEGEIVFYSLDGKELKHYRVDKTFNTLIVNNSEFPQGTYIYKLITDKGTTDGIRVIQSK